MKITRDDIDIELLDADPNQPRKHFDETEHVELVRSMCEHGFAFGALLVRPKGERFEIVVGERRTRAAREAVEILTAKIPLAEEIERDGIENRIKSLRFLPCAVDDELTDVQVIELQLVENLQRKGLTPIEEADGYQQLLNLRDPVSGEPLHTHETIAKRIGKSRDVIARRVMLCNLNADPEKFPVTAEARRNVESKTLPAMTAYLIARIPDPARREDAARIVLHPEVETGPLGFRDADREISRHCMRKLNATPFDQDDALLVPVQADEAGNRLAGGACGDCLFRTIAAAQHGGDRTSRCLNPQCYDLKVSAEWERWMKSETDPARRRRAVTRSESEEIFSSDIPDQPTRSSGLVALDQYPAGDELQKGVEAPGTWRTLTANAEIETVVARDRNGRTQELVDRKAAITAAQTLNSFDVFKGDDRSKDKPSRRSLGLAPPDEVPETDRETWLNNAASREEVDADRKRKEKQREESEARRKTILFACFDELRSKAKSSAGFLRRLALFIFGLRQVNPELLQRNRLPVALDISRNIARWKDAELIAFIVELILTDAGYNFEMDEDDRAWLKMFGVDYNGHERRLDKLDAKFKASDKKALAKAKGAAT